MCRVFVQVMSLTRYMCEPITLFNNDETTSLPHICKYSRFAKKKIRFSSLQYSFFYLLWICVVNFLLYEKKKIHHNKRESSSFSVYVPCIYIDRLLKKILFYLFDSILVILRWEVCNQNWRRCKLPDLILNRRIRENKHFFFFLKYHDGYNWFKCNWQFFFLQRTYTWKKSTFQNKTTFQILNGFMKTQHWKWCFSVCFLLYEKWKLFSIEAHKNIWSNILEHEKAFSISICFSSE